MIDWSHGYAAETVDRSAGEGGKGWMGFSAADSLTLSSTFFVTETVFFTASLVNQFVFTGNFLASHIVV